MTGSIGAWRALVLGVVAVCGVIAVAASGQGARPASAGAFGTVDVQRVTNEYKAMRVAQTELQARQGKANARIQRRVNMPYLADDEHKQLDDIEAKDPAGRSAAEVAKAKELADKGIKLSGELAALAQKPDKDLTDADRQRIKDAEAARTKVEALIASIRDEEDTKLREYGMANQERLTKEFRAAVKRVSEKKGLTIVFDVQVAVYAGADITEEVVKDLNAK
jgi:Skp family chaperone for outer membrane proteins